jgi:hypothetical protein
MSKKRNEHKKLHQRRRKARAQSDTQPQREKPARSAFRLRAPPSEYDQMSVFIDERALGLKETTLADLRALVRKLPFESAMLSLALVNLRAERVLNDAAGQWELARWFYEGRPDLLARYEQVRQRSPDRPIFSPQPIAMLMRLLIDEAREQPFAPITPGDFHTLQRAVLGAHSALESPLEAMPKPTDEAKVAFEMQASAFFNRPPWLEEMTRSDEFLELMRSEELRDSKHYVPADDWLSASGLTADQQWVLGFGFAATTKAFDNAPVTPRVQAKHVEELLTRLGLSSVSQQVPIISATRAELQAGFEALGGGDAAMSWEFRPFKTTPFLRFANGDLVLLGMPWLLSWLGEGFHFRALTHAQKSEGSKVSGRYNTFMGEVVERYALDLAHAAVDDRARVLGEQPYGKGGGKRTTDVAVVWGRDLILFEVHARRVKADVLAIGEVTEALEEVSKLLVVKIDQVASRIEELFAGEATLPDMELDSIERIWPVVVSVGHLIQTQHVWNYLRASVKAETTGTLTKTRVQPLQVLDITDYERLLGIIEAGASLPAMLARKTKGPFAERDLAAWLSGDSSAPSADSRLSLLEKRWEAMGAKLQRTRELAQDAQEAVSEELQAE